MSSYSKEEIGKFDNNNVICKSHSARSDRELFRICPSKLSKRELEDLYFTLLENNLELKRKINGQQDKIRGLSTKVQRMTATQKSLQAKETKDCCVGTKSIVAEQKESIEELKYINQRMAERIRMLNMRLCSAKQFSKKTPQMSTPRLYHSANASTPKKHTCSPRMKEPIQNVGVTGPNLERDQISMKSVQTGTRGLERHNADLPCDENKCKTAMEELKLKIVNLQEELCNTHSEYSTRIGRLESEILEVRKENMRVRSERGASDHELQNAARRTSELLVTLRTAESRCAELKTQLSIEKRKVVEMKIRLKAARISDQVNRTIQQMTSRNDINMCACSPSDADELAESTLKEDAKSTCLCCSSQDGEATKSKMQNTLRITDDELPPMERTNQEDAKILILSDDFGQTNNFPGVTDEELSQKARADQKDAKIFTVPDEFGQTNTFTRDADQELLPKAMIYQKDAKILTMSDDFGQTNVSPRVSDEELSPRAMADQTYTKISKVSEDFEQANPTLATPTAGDEELSPKAKTHQEDAKTSRKYEGSGQMNISSKVTDDKLVPKMKTRQNDARISRRSDNFGQTNTSPRFADKELSPKVKTDHEDAKISRVSDDSGYLDATRSQDRDDDVLSSDLNHELIKAIVELQNRTNTVETLRATESPVANQDLRSESSEIYYDVIPSKSSNDKPEAEELGNKYKKKISTIVECCKDNKPELALDEPKAFEGRGKNTSELGPVNNKLGILESSDTNQLTILSKQTMPIIGDANTKVQTKEEYRPKPTQLFPNSSMAAVQCRKPSKTELDGKLKMGTTLEHRPSKSELIFGDLHKDSVPNKIDMLSTDGQAADNPVLEVVTDEPHKLDSRVVATTSKEYCKYCAACLCERHCSKRPCRYKYDGAGIKIGHVKKHDQHNSLQIPGPIPVADNNSNKDWKQIIFRHLSLDGKRKDSLKKDKNSKQIKKTLSKDVASETKKVTNQKESDFVTNIKTVPEFRNFRIVTQTSEEERDNDIRALRKNARYNSGRNFGRENFEIDQHQDTRKKDTDGGGTQDVSLNNDYIQSDNMRHTTAPYNNAEHERKSDQRPHEQTGQDRDIGTQAKYLDVRPSGQRPQRLTSEQGTYTVGSKQTRSTSPDNTECEISSMTDLPSERDANSPVRSPPLSPGEDKMTSTYTDSYTSPGTNISLSEGEMLATTSRKISTAALKPSVAFSTTPITNVTSENMEITLQSIKEELARCRKLLLSQRPYEIAGHESRQSQTTVPDDQSDHIELRRCTATQGIGDTYAPKCNFTLHIGTLVLSDEAILNSRDKNLVLTWKFYDQNTAMSRMRAGRVVLFDFSTEYDIKITNEFLNYMKHEEMPIVICELDKQDQPFASCALPLREALLHTNRRADISLALVAGPQMLFARAANCESTDALDARDEMGVIDLWFMLQADSKHLQFINRVIARPSTPAIRSNQFFRHNSRMLEQVIEDDPFNEFVDMDLTLENRNPLPSGMGKEMTKDFTTDVEYSHRSRRCDTLESSTMRPDMNVLTRAEQSFDPSKYPPLRRVSGIKRTPSAPSVSESNLEEPDRDSSDIIVNEVEAKIKSSSDMKAAFERSGPLKAFAKWPRIIDDDMTSQAQSSISSLRSIMARMQRRQNPQNIQPNQELRRTSLNHNMKKNSKTAHGELSDLELFKKYENISALIGSNRAETSKKSVTIMPEYIQPVLEKPERDRKKSLQEVQVEQHPQKLDITVQWLALNEECEAMLDSHVQKVYVAYSFLGRNGADLETPVSLPKPKHYVDKCYFNFKKTFELKDSDLPMLGHMARCRASSKATNYAKDCIVFAVISEPPEDPLGLETCEDIGFAYLYLGDLLAYSTGSTCYTEVIPVRAARGGESICGVLAVRLDGLDVVRRCLLLANKQDMATWALH